MRLLPAELGDDAGLVGAPAWTRAFGPRNIRRKRDPECPVSLKEQISAPLSLTQARVSLLWPRRSRLVFPARVRPVEPVAQLFVDVRMVEQVEMVQATHVATLVDFERQDAPKPTARSAGKPNEEVTEQQSQGWWGVPRDGDTHEVVVGGGEKRDLPTRFLRNSVWVLAPPVALEARAKAQVLDPGASRLEACGERSGFGEAVKRPSHDVGTLLHVGAEVGRGQAEDVADQARPSAVVLRCLMTRASYDQPTHRVSDQGDLLNRTRPAVHDLGEQARQGAAVVGDVQPAVVSQVEGRVPKIAVQPQAVRGLRYLPLSDRNRTRTGRSRAQPVGEHGQSWRGIRKGSRQLSWSQADRSPSPRVKIMGSASSLPVLASVSPRTPLRMPRATLPNLESEIRGGFSRVARTTLEASARGSTWCVPSSTL